MREKIAEGKTKIIERDRHTGFAVITSKDDVTAGDGARHEVVPGKGALSTRMTGSIFSLLEYCGFRVAYVGEDEHDPRVFTSLLAEPLPFEFVARVRAEGSILKRNPGVQRGQRFEHPVGEVYLKTSDRCFKSLHRDKVYGDLACDDPLVRFDGQVLRLHSPSEHFSEHRYFATVDSRDIFRYPAHAGTVLKSLTSTTVDIIRVLEHACWEVGIEIDDLKVEYGTIGTSQPYLIDVIDCDSWRARYKGERIDKQPFREGEPVEETLRRYELAAKLVEPFRQRHFQTQVKTWWRQQERSR